MACSRHLCSSLFSQSCGETSAVWCQQVISCIGLIPALHAYYIHVYFMCEKASKKLDKNLITHQSSEYVSCILEYVGILREHADTILDGCVAGMTKCSKGTRNVRGRSCKEPASSGDTSSTCWPRGFVI